MVQAPKILLVDDSDDILELMSFILQSEGAEVECALDGVEACEKLDPSYDAVLLDVQMPNMDGLRFLRDHCAAIAPNVPVVVYTSHENEQLVNELFQAGATKVLHKPLRAIELKKEIYELIDQATKP